LERIFEYCSLFVFSRNLHWTTNTRPCSMHYAAEYLNNVIIITIIINRTCFCCRTVHEQPQKGRGKLLIDWLVLTARQHREVNRFQLHRGMKTCSSDSVKLLTWYVMPRMTNSMSVPQPTRLIYSTHSECQNYSGSVSLFY